MRTISLNNKILFNSISLENKNKITLKKDFLFTCKDEISSCYFFRFE